MEDKDGFFIDDEKIIIKQKNKIEDLPFDSNTKCMFCDSPFLDFEISKIFSIYCCRQCRYEKLKFITKTCAIKNYLLNEYDLRDLKYITRPNPHKGNWHDMILYIENQIKSICMKKYGNEEAVEEIIKNRKESIKQRKIKKLKTKIRDLKRRTIVKTNTREQHSHEFTGIGGVKKCIICGMKIEQEEI